MSDYPGTPEAVAFELTKLILAPQSDPQARSEANVLRLYKACLSAIQETDVSYKPDYSNL